MRCRADLHPGAAPVHADLHQDFFRGSAGRHRTDAATGHATDAMHARAEQHIGMGLVGKSQAQGIHRAAL